MREGCLIPITMRHDQPARRFNRDSTFERNNQLLALNDCHNICRAVLERPGVCGEHAIVARFYLAYG
jgi:hypothetical protein